MKIKEKIESLKKYKGFTIVEIVVVIAVIGILAAVLIPTFSGVVTNANKSKEMQQAKNAYTEFLIEDPNNVSENYDLLIDSGDYLFTVSNNTFNVTEIEDTISGITEVGDMTISGNVGIGEEYYVKEGNHYIKKSGLGNDETNYYTTFNHKTSYDLTGYTFYGIFNNCAVYTKDK